MAEKTFLCRECSQLNAINQTICKNCGADLKKQVLDSFKHVEKTKRSSAPKLIFAIFCVIVILVIISAAVIPKFIRFDGGSSPITARNAARGVGGAINATIQAEHSDYRINGVTYTLDDVLSGTAYASGIKYQARPNNTPAKNEICSNVDGTAILLNFRGTILKWTYTPQPDNSPALITEDSASFTLN